MRAAVLHGPGDLRVVADAELVVPEGWVEVEVLAACACGTDRKMLERGHPILPPYPCGFGHETAGRRVDTGELVFVGDSVACGACGPCRAGRRQLCRAMTWVLGGFAERLAAPVGALHALPAGFDDVAAAAVAEPLAACVHAVARCPASSGSAVVLGGGTIGLMCARLLVLSGRAVVVVDRHAARRAQAEAYGAGAVASLDAVGAPPELVLECVGRGEAWRDAVLACAPGGTVVLVGGCAGDVALPSGQLHYDEVDVRGAFHHDRSEVDEALRLLASGAVDVRPLLDDPIGLDDLPRALQTMAGGPARKPLVLPTPSSGTVPFIV